MLIIAGRDGSMCIVHVAARKLLCGCSVSVLCEYGLCGTAIVIQIGMAEKLQLTRYVYNLVIYVSLRYCK